MYLSYYKLNKKPFQISTDPSFFWLGEKHKEALSILKYGVMDDKGFLLLTGDVGTGKTTLINAFVNSLGNEVIISRVSDPGLTQLDFISYIAKMFKIEAEVETKSEFLILFTEFLEQADRDDKKVLLIIDEAQHLTDETLEEIRLLSNIENQDKKLLNIFLVGQSEFNETLEKYKNRALRQRLTLNYTLYPFKAEETKACIEYRLKVAGAENEIFTPEAIDVIHTISNGFPRVINIICDHALRLGCQEDQKTISAAIIHKCSKTLHAAHLPQSHQYDSHFGSTNEWLEESEVPPLSPEAINRVSQPLPDFIVDNETETTEKARPYIAIVPLILAGLFIFGFFLYKDGNLESVSKFLSSLQKNTITIFTKEKGDVNDSPEIVQKAEELLSSETISASGNTSTSPVILTKKLNKQIFEVNVSEEVIDTKIPETTSETIMDNINTEPPLITEPEPSFTQIPTNTEKTIYDESETTETQSEDVSVDVEIEPPSISEKGTPVVDIEIQDFIQVMPDAITSENSNMKEVLSNDVQKDDNFKSEIIEKPLQPPVNQTPAIVEKNIENKKHPSPQREVESVPQDVDSIVVRRRTQSESKKATPSSSKKTSETNDDPGAIIDWLLKSK